MGKTRILRPRRDRNENDFDIETTPDQKSEINGKKHLHNRMFRAIITQKGFGIVRVGFRPLFFVRLLNELKGYNVVMKI